MALTNTFVNQVKHTGKPTGDKYTDAGAMFLLVKASGKYWRMDYSHNGKRKTLALGVYPAVTLATARALRDKAREELDRVAGCSNGPELISNLRQRGLEIPCERTKKKDRDLFDCYPGVYFLTPKDRRLVFRWIDERDKLNAIKTIATDPTTTGLKRAKPLKEVRHETR